MAEVVGVGLDRVRRATTGREMPQKARDDRDRLTSIVQQLDREVSRALPTAATHPQRRPPRIADPIVERAPDGIVAPPGLLTRPATRHPATSSTQPTVHIRIEMIFGAYDLLGLRFAPRIRDLDRQRLYQHGSMPAVDVGELLKHKLRPDLITPYWDELLRLAASLQHGWAPASLLLSRLQAGSRRNPLARALQEYGRLVKTNFVLAWLVDEELRRRVGRQLNKGEQLHALRRFLFYANEGHVRHRTPEQQTDQALCLTIVCNAIIVWNTVYTQRVLDQLRADGQLITTSEIEQISPLPHQHITPTATTPSASPAARATTTRCAPPKTPSRRPPTH